MADKFTLVRAPLNMETCKYAFFPGCCLCANEPEIVAKTYDALLFQNSATAIFIQCCDDVEEIRQKWNELGQPEMIMCCQECREVFTDKLPEIPVASLYDKFIEYEISGGCNSVDYCLHQSVPGYAADNISDNSVASLAEDMGVTLHPYEDNSAYPYLVSDINVRNRIKNEGHDAAHIMELMFGMGASNTHLIHEHEHGDEPSDSECSSETECSSNAKADPLECNGNCSECAGCHDKPHPPQPLPDDAQKEANRLELKEVLLALYWNEL